MRDTVRNYSIGTFSWHRCQLSRNVLDSHGIVGDVPRPARIAALSRILAFTVSLGRRLGASLGTTETTCESQSACDSVIRDSVNCERVSSP